MSLQNQTPVPILQNEWEFYKLLDEYKRLRPEFIIEIGSFFGGTLYHWLYNNDNLKSVTCIDLPIEPNDGRYNQMVESRLKWEGWVMETFKRPTCFHNLKGNSTDPNIVARAYEVNKPAVDFLFIDGDHSYEGVKADYDNYQDLVRPGGLIVFHDVIGYWSVNKFWNEVKKDKKYIEICAGGPDGWGIGIIEK